LGPVEPVAPWAPGGPWEPPPPPVSYSPMITVDISK
jgi:hypothetical protein